MPGQQLVAGPEAGVDDSATDATEASGRARPRCASTAAARAVAWSRVGNAGGVAGSSVAGSWILQRSESLVRKISSLAPSPVITRRGPLRSRRCLSLISKAARVAATRGSSQIRRGVSIPVTELLSSIPSGKVKMSAMASCSL